VQENGPSTQEMLRLVELDYQRTTEFISGVVGTTATLRGWGVTLWVAVVGVAVDHSAPGLALVGSLIAVVFFILDGYHAWLYGTAQEHAASLERISSAYYNSLGRGKGEEYSALRLQTELQSHRFGLYQNLGKFRWKSWGRVRPKVVFIVFYPLLFVIPGLVGLWIALT
jgi:hypothetical protein